MKKYLYVEFINNWDRITSKEMDSELDIPIKRRMVKIQLTPEQIKQLEPKIVGNNAERDIQEEVRLICIQCEK